MTNISTVRRTFTHKPGRVAIPILFGSLLTVSSFAGTVAGNIPDTLKSAIQTKQHLVEPDGHGFHGENAENRLALHFEGDSATIITQGSSTRIHLSAFGREHSWNTPSYPVTKAVGNKVSYQTKDLTEWFVNDATGLEQGFQLSKRPAGSGALELKLAVDGGLSPQLENNDAVLLQKRGATVLRYAGLKAWDADGHTLQTSMDVRGAEIRLVVQDGNAVYPITIDPTLQQAKLTAPDALSGDNFGYSVAMSGTTALVGSFGNADFTGAAYVYVQNGTTWTEQAKLTASDGTTFNNFGESVALYGNTALVGAFENKASTGAVYVFVRNGTTWTQQAKLVASNGQTSDEFGYSVALYGTTAVIGALDANKLTGSAYVFVTDGTTWTQQAELIASDGAEFDSFGDSVSISGTIAVVGARSHAKNGAAYVFVQNGTKWTQQTELLASDGAVNDYFGCAVSIDGTTALIGAYNNNNSEGAAYVFVQSGTTWAQQAKLIAIGGAPGYEFGHAVSISANAALVGSPFLGYTVGSAYLFIRSGAAWVQQYAIYASDYATNDEFGTSVSFNGNLGIVGAPFKANSAGAGYIYFTPLTTPTPASGTPGTQITVAGSGFVPNEKVYITWNSPREYLVTATADATGSFSGVALTVPTTSAVGINSFFASGAVSKDLGIGYFTVE